MPHSTDNNRCFRYDAITRMNRAAQGGGKDLVINIQTIDG